MACSALATLVYPRATKSKPLAFANAPIAVDGPLAALL